MPVYLQHSLDALYPDVPARGSDTMMWADFCNMGGNIRIQGIQGMLQVNRHSGAVAAFQSRNNKDVYKRQLPKR